jgi:predicted RNA polymerase sigma factor
MAGTDRQSGRRTKREFHGSCKNEILLGQDRLCAVAHRIVHDMSRAEDVIPDALAQILRAWPHVLQCVAT